MAKKILFVSNEGQIGGATNALINIVTNLNEEYEPIVLMNKKGPLADVCDQKKIKYIILKYKPFIIGEGTTNLKRIIKILILPILKIQYLLYNPMALKRIVKLINMNEICLIHTNVNRDDFGALLSKKYHIPHVWHLREFGDKDYKCYYFNKNYISFMNQNTDAFIVISNAIKQNFIEKGIHANKMHLIYDGIQCNKKFNKSFSKQKLKILFMGGILESKGQIELIEALHLIPKSILKNIYVSFYGNGTHTYIQHLKKKILNYEIPNIEFHEYKSDIHKIIKNFDVGMMCSRSEGFGLVTVEYMTNKLITIVSNRGANVEIMNKESGFIYEYGNYYDLANIIITIYNMSDTEKQNIANNGFERAKYFSAENNAQKIMDLYKELTYEKNRNEK